MYQLLRIVGTTKTTTAELSIPVKTESATISPSVMTFRITSTHSSSEITYSMRRHGVAMDALRVARDAILSLVENRDFLGFQLAHANGAMSDGDMDIIADKFLSGPRVFDETEVARKAAFLAGIVPEKFDAELVSLVFHCELDEAERAIRNATDNLDRFLPEDAYGLVSAK